MPNEYDDYLQYRRTGQVAGRPSKTAAPERTGTAARPTTVKESMDMAILGDTHEEFSLDGTGISHVPGVAKPEFGGLVRGITPDDPASVLIRDGALRILTDDLDVALAWRNAWQAAVSQLIIERDRQAAKALAAES